MTVAYSTSDGSATSAAEQRLRLDQRHADLRRQDRDQEKTITVPINDDCVVEPERDLHRRPERRGECDDRGRAGRRHDPATTTRASRSISTRRTAESTGAWRPRRRSPGPPARPARLRSTSTSTSRTTAAAAATARSLLVNEANDGTFSWFIPKTYSRSTARIKVVGTDLPANNVSEDASDADFDIFAGSVQAEASFALHHPRTRIPASRIPVTLHRPDVQAVRAFTPSPSSCRRSSRSAQPQFADGDFPAERSGRTGDQPAPGHEQRRRVLHRRPGAARQRAASPAAPPVPRPRTPCCSRPRCHQHGPQRHRTDLDRGAGRR